MTEQLPATVLQGALAPPAEGEIAARLARHAHRARGAVAPETARAMAKGSAAWTRWCSERGVHALPASADAVADYVDALAEGGRKVASIRQAVWAVSRLHMAAELPDPTKGETVGLALKRVARSTGTRQRQAAPLGEDDVRLILRQMGNRLADLRDVALLLVMRDLLARRSEAVALEVADVTWNRDGSAAVLIRRSKTDQAGQGETRWLAPATVARLRAWLDVAGVHEGAIFRSVNKAGATGGQLAGGDVPRILKRLAALAPGLDPSTVSGHSCRVGMAQDLVAAGEELAGVMQAGRWRSPMMPARYAEKLEAGRGAVARFYGKRRG